MELNVTVNSRVHRRDVAPRTLLVHFLRDHLGLLGTHLACDTSQCGACTVLLDGLAVKSCTVLALQADGAAVTTIEGVSPPGQLHPVQQALWQYHGVQCGYCTAGIVMTSLALLRANPRPTAAEIKAGLEGHICRCTGYENIVKAIQAAAAGQQAEVGSAAPEL
jgi:carbon-monoxide dehydrogenase small subunit